MIDLAFVAQGYSVCRCQDQAARVSGRNEKLENKIDYVQGKQEILASLRQFLHCLQTRLLLLLLDVVAIIFHG